MMGPPTITLADHTELVDRLRQHHNETATLPHDGNDAFRLAADAITAQAAQIDALNERLENNHAFNMAGERVDVAPGSIPDGIACRDETIKGQDEQIAALVAKRDAQAALIAEQAGEIGKLQELRVTDVALRFPTGLIVTMPRPHRHGSLINHTYSTLGNEREDGFMLSDGTFADRKRAYEAAEAAGQIIWRFPEGGLYDPPSLFSENLWEERFSAAQDQGESPA